MLSLCVCRPRSRILPVGAALVLGLVAMLCSTIVLPLLLQGAVLLTPVSSVAVLVPHVLLDTFLSLRVAHGSCTW